jgi:hypothetical protein
MPHLFPVWNSSVIPKKCEDDNTPYQMACEACGRDEVMKVIVYTLLDYQRSHDSTGPYNLMDALMTAAIEEYIHLDCVYFLLRRQPAVLKKLQLSSSSTKSVTKTRYNIRKRKRRREL